MLEMNTMVAKAKGLGFDIVFIESTGIYQRCSISLSRKKYECCWRISVGCNRPQRCSSFRWISFRWVSRFETHSTCLKYSVLFEFWVSPKNLDSRNAFYIVLLLLQRTSQVWFQSELARPSLVLQSHFETHDVIQIVHKSSIAKILQRAKFRHVWSVLFTKPTEFFRQKGIPITCYQWLKKDVQ